MVLSSGSRLTTLRRPVRYLTPQRAQALGLVVVAVIAAVDALAQGDVILIGLLSLGTFAAAFRASSRETALVGGAAVALALLLGWPDGILFTADHLVRTAVVAVSSGVAVAFAELREQREEALRRIARVAEVAQRAILREPPSAIGNVRIAARYLSAAEDALIGGDLYETAFTPQGVRLIVGDVRGKGLEAVGLAARVLSAFREHALNCDSLAELARAVDKEVASAVTDEEFVTALLVEFDQDDDGVRLVNCGHHPPLRVSARDHPAFLATGPHDLPLGLGPDITETVVRLDAGDRLLLYTDGLVEARSPNGDDFDLVGHALVLRHDDINKAIDDLLDRLRDHVGHGLTDDVAVMLTTILG